MSTKTTIKRLALVTVAALGLGVLSVAPSNAAPQADTLALAAATASTTVGTAVTVNATVSFLQETSSDTMTLSLTYNEAPAGITAGEVTINSPATAATTDLGTPTVDTTTARVAKVSAATAASINKTLVITLTPTKAGTYVIKVTPTLSSGTAVSTAKTWTVTVAAAVVAPISATYSTVKMNTTSCSTNNVWQYNNCYGVDGYGAYAIATDSVTATATLANTNYTAEGALIASFKLDQKNGASNTMASTVPWTVAITSGPGKVQMGNRAVSAKSVTESVLTTGQDGYQAAGSEKSAYFLSDGTTGKTVITFTAGGVLIGTRTITVYGPATKLVATQSGGLASYTGVGAGKTTVHTITAVDVNAAAATLPTGLTVKSSDTAVATVEIAGNNTVTVTGVKAGTAVITVTDPATSAAATAATYTVTVKANKPTTAPTITFDKTAYNVGDVITMTVGADMADSATAQLFTGAIGTSASVITVPGATALPAGGQHAIVAGVATYKFYAPAVSGSFTVTATGGSDIDLTTLVTAPVVTKTIDIINAAADAAQMAAEEATAAAQDATDAALDAATAAEAAGALAQEAVDLVTELSANVTKLISDLKAQITTLTNLVIKIQKKVGAK